VYIEGLRNNRLDEEDKILLNRVDCTLSNLESSYSDCCCCCCWEYSGNLDRFFWKKVFAEKPSVYYVAVVIRIRLLAFGEMGRKRLVADKLAGHIGMMRIVEIERNFAEKRLG
jgi:hypothetical protein